jgi:hypothetical protein
MKQWGSIANFYLAIPLSGVQAPARAEGTRTYDMILNGHLTLFEENCQWDAGRMLYEAPR